MKAIHCIAASALLIMPMVSCSSSGEKAPAFKHAAKETPLSNDSVERMIDSLYARMTPGERLAQLQSNYITDFLDDEGNLDTLKCRELIPDGIGHIPQWAENSVDSPEKLRDITVALQTWLVENTPSGIPAMFHEEALSGFCALGSTIYPQQIGQACSFNTDLAAEKTRQTAQAMRQLGGTLALSPMVDVVRNPYFNRLEESYGEDAYLSAAFGSAFVEGLQHGGLKHGVPACSKHFLGYGGGGDSDDKELYEEILLPHEAMIRTQGSKVVMMGYHQVRDTFCTANRFLMQDVLRDYLGFDGMIVTDYGAMNEAGIDPDRMARAAKSLRAGMDVEFQMRENYTTLPAAIEAGLVSEAELEQAVKRVLRMKAAVGLLDPDRKFAAEGKIVYDTPEERKTAYDIASQSVVLLKNDGVLPLDQPRKIALVGPNANSIWAMLGDYAYPAMQLFWRNIDTAPLMEAQVVKLKDAMESGLPAGSSIEYEAGCDWATPAARTTSTGGDERAYWLDKSRRVARDEDFDADRAIEIAKGSDVIVAAMGENIFLCGENRDREGLRLPGEQEAFVRRLVETGKPVVLVMFGGRALVLGDLADKCAAVMHAWYPGEEGGNAVADILYGKANPSGKLSVSYSRVELNENICYNRSLEPDSRVQWPFGYGLSYTDFEYSDLKVDKSVATDAESIGISMRVANKGQRAGEEVVQLYVSPADGNPNLKPIKLAGFARVALQPGESKRVEFAMSPEQLGYWAGGQWHVAPGEYVIKAAASSADVRAQQTVALTGQEVVKPLRSVYFTEVVSQR